MAISYRELGSKDILGEPPLRPKDMLLAQAAGMPSPRPIEHCRWFKYRQIDFDIPPEGIIDPRQQQFKDLLTESLGRQGHPPSQDRPSQDSHMIIGFHNVPDDSRPLLERIGEIPAKVMVADDRYDLPNILKQNYITAITVSEDIVGMGKRSMEELSRSCMLRLGTVKLLFLTPDADVLVTLEGGAGFERRSNEAAIDGMRNRLVTHACTEEAGKYNGVKNVLSRQAWEESRMPDYLAAAFRQSGAWGFIDRPYDMSRAGASAKRVKTAQELMGYSRQSESAGAIMAHTLLLPERYQMGDADGGIIATKTGRNFNIDKRFLDRDDTVPVSIVPLSSDQHSGTLEDFQRFSLGIQGSEVGWPSIEFDEMANAFHTAPIRRVSRHPKRNGWILDEHGTHRLKNARAYWHAHVAVEEIFSRTIRGVNARELVEYVPANLKDFPYPVGCGSNIQFEATADAIARSEAIQDPHSSYQVVLFDYPDHGLGAAIAAKVIPGIPRTEPQVIPDNPFDFFLELIEPYRGPVKLTDQIPQI